tara:strand:+ start:179451 stop:180947 length:1497 start_codon:yes stop_codon:yes gene_type:complete
MSNLIYNGYAVTDEQQVTIDWAHDKGSQKIEACAGAGKTSTLGAISETLMLQGKRGLYIAFNKSIAEEAQNKMPHNVTARTAHSLAYRECAIPFQQAGKLGRCYPSVIARELRIAPIQPMTATSVADVVLSAVTKFCYSADDEISEQHVNMYDFAKAGFDNNDMLSIRLTLLSYARLLWERMLRLNDPMPITHDVYLKVWCLSKPVLNYDFILFDEAQDANPVLVDLVQRQHASLMFVGDRYQQIYSWRGATNAMQNVQIQTNNLTQSFRFGQNVAGVANEILRTQLDVDSNIRGFDDITSDIARLDIDNVDCIISRTNAGLFKNIFNAVDAGKSCYVNGGVYPILSLFEGISRLQSGNRSDHSDLRIFTNYMEFTEFTESAAGSDMKVPMKLIAEHGLDSLINTIKKVQYIKKDNADYVLTTAHKSKGLEWPRVRLDSDFKMMPDKSENAKVDPFNTWKPEEANLLYVASTRAKLTLDCSRVADIAHLCGELAEEAA